MTVATITVLQIGSRGPEVADLQHLLMARGGAHSTDLGAIDGVFGPRTQAAVINFQRHQPAQNNGVVEHETWKALAEAPEWPNQIPGQFLRPGDRGEGVKQLQKGLRNHKVYGGLIDGAFGPVTQQAVMELQRRQTVSNVQGIVGPMTFMGATA